VCSSYRLRKLLPRFENTAVRGHWSTDEVGRPWAHEGPEWRAAWLSEFVPQSELHDPRLGQQASVSAEGLWQLLQRSNACAGGSGLQA
jgi:hypothetical protein